MEVKDEKEEEELVERINQLDNSDDFFELPNSWRDKGREEGRLAEKEEFVRKSLSKNLDIDFIAELSGLSVERILEIKEENDL